MGTAPERSGLFAPGTPVPAVAGLAEGLDVMNEVVVCRKSFANHTLSELQTAGRNGKEGVVLWLGQRTSARRRIEVDEALCPDHQASRDHFWFSARAMRRIREVLRTQGLMIAAQVHTHPGHAFHSQADDEWAITRHQGALSLVIPHFALGTSWETLPADVACYRLSAENKWLRSPPPTKDDECLIFR